MINHLIASIGRTQTEKSFGAVVVSPVGDIDGEMCSRLIPETNTGPKSLMTTEPLLPLNAQHSPGRTPDLMHNYGHFMLLQIPKA